MTKVRTNQQYIPVVTDVVVLGNPVLKKMAKNKMTTQRHAAINFQRRIDDVESAIGQDEVHSPSRAHAIRSEALQHAV
ncbi:MAG TPA: DUF2486 family protein [Thiotrichaceae bacterium]|nr:DUF2486 family protein [Thiotrichaceae bacterium]